MTTNVMGPLTPVDYHWTQVLAAIADGVMFRQRRRPQTGNERLPAAMVPQSRLRTGWSRESAERDELSAQLPLMGDSSDIGADGLDHLATGPTPGSPAFTHRQGGRGSAFWFGSIPDMETVRSVLEVVTETAGVHPVLADLPDQVEAVRRGNVVTVVNHGQEPASLSVSGTDLLTGEELTRFTLDAQAFRFIEVLEKHNSHQPIERPSAGARITQRS